MLNNLKKAKETGEIVTQEAAVLDTKGNKLWYHSTLVPVNDDKGSLDYIMVVSIETTERKQAEALVHKLSNAVTGAGSSILITDRAGIIEYVNPAFTKMTGYNIHEVMGKTPRILNSGNQDTAFYKAMWKTIMNGKVWHGKVIDKRKDGSFFPAMLWKM